MTENQTPLNENYIRLARILEIVPVSRSTWYRGVKTGIYPQPVKISARASAWKVEDIRRCLAYLASDQPTFLPKSPPMIP